jgi:hypothetical protein
MTDIQDNLPEADGQNKEDLGNNPSTENTRENTTQPEEQTSEPEIVEDEVKEESPEPEAQKEEVAEATVTEEEKSTETVAELTEKGEMSDEELEEEDDHEEVESDEEEHEHTVEEELELPDYSEYEPEKLVEEAEKLLKNEAVHKIKAHFDAIRKNLLDHLNDEKKQRLAEFLEGGGVEMDFEFIQPLRQRFKQIFTEYRSRRQAYYNDLQEKLENNLKVKKELIEKIKEIVSKDESIGETFKEFNALQQEWRNTGPVPRNESSNLWQTYHHHVENFYEFIKINKELRDLDFKKNHETKEVLIQKVEALATETDIKKAFSELQSIHKQWKRVGPVERDHREPMWERFSAATKKLHDRREEYYEEQKEKSAELIEQKKSLVQKIEEFPFENIKSHNKWQEAIKGVEAIREGFRKIGRVNHPENDVIWDKFREVLREFNHLKNQFYKDLKKDQHQNLLKKKALLDLAESLKDSDDWKVTTNEFKRIQADWKRIGHVPRAESDKIWKKFREACNHFFNRLTDHNKDLDKSYDGNFESKEALLEKLKGFEGSGDQKADVQSLMNIINEWKSIGRVPRDKTNIESDFNNALDGQFKAIDLDRKESQRIRFENKMNSMAERSGNDRELVKEKDYLRRKREEAQKELNTLENNMAFFSSSNPNSPFMKEAEKNISKQRDIINELTEKMKMLSKTIKEMNTPKEEEPSDNQTEGDA